MQKLAFIFAIYLVQLVIMPCSDWNTCDEGEKTELAGNHDHSEDEGDNCTAFCSCACCGMQITFNEIRLPSLSILQAAPTQSFSYRSPYSFDLNEGIWHPPARG